MRYLDRSGLMPRLTSVFERYRSNQKGTSVADFLRQTIAFFVDGTSRHLTHFDDTGFAAILETAQEQMASSHAIKRFFNKVVNVDDRPLRSLLRQMGISRICYEKTHVIEFSSIQWRNRGQLNAK